MRGLFVTATDTGVGKTVLSAALLAAMRADGEPRARVQAGRHRPRGPSGDRRRGAWPPDHELLAARRRHAPEEVAPLRYGPAVSPHLAAELAGERDRRRAAARRARARRAPERRTLIVEGVGGLLVPLAEGFSVLRPRGRARRCRC